MLDQLARLWAENSEFLLSALWTTLLLNVVSLALALASGLALGLARTYGPRVLAVPLTLFTDALRSIPILVIILWCYLALPLLIGEPNFPSFTAAVIALGLHTGAYTSEEFKAGIRSIREGQSRAASALGMSRTQSVRHVVLPQATIRMLPTLGSRVAQHIKDSTLASTIAVSELVYAGTVLEGKTSLAFPIYTTLIVIYFILSAVPAIGVNHLYSRLSHRAVA